MNDTVNESSVEELREAAIEALKKYLVASELPTAEQKFRLNRFENTVL